MKRLTPTCVLAIAISAGAAGAGCSSAGTSSTAAQPGAPTANQVRARLLTIADLPAGWASTPASPPSSTTGQFCSMKKDVFGSIDSGQQVAFKSAANSSIIPTELVETVTYDSAAQADFSRVRTFLNGCHTTTTTSGGATGTATMAKMSFPAIGDQSAAWLFTAQASFISVSAPLVLARHGNYVVLLAMTQPGDTGEATLESVAKTAIKRLDHPGPAPTNSTPSTVAATTPTATTRPAGHVGATVTLQTQNVALTQVYDPAAPDPSGIGPPEGQHLVGAELTITNTGTDPFIPEPLQDATLIDTAGQSYTPAVWPSPSCQQFASSVVADPGLSVSGCVLFQVPAGSTPARLQYQPRQDNKFGEWLIP